MSNETMGQIIKRLRKERNLTQEELAEQLNISAPAISKWENDTSMPDISQVVPLANLFGVPTDVLFGVYGTDHEEEVHARLEEVFRLSDNCKDGEEGPTAIIILDKYREAMRLYPNNPAIMGNASAFAQMVIDNFEPELKELIGEEGIDSLTEEIIHWAGLVIKYSTDINDVLSAKNRLIDIHVRRKNWDAAHEMVETFPRYIYDTYGIQMASLKYHAGKTAEEREWRCQNISELAGSLGYQTAMLGNLYRREGQYEDALYCYSFMRDMVESMYREEKYRPPFIHDYYPLYHYPAYCLIKLGRCDEAVTLLEEGVQFILTVAENYNKKSDLDIPLLCDCSFGYGFDGTAEYGDVTRRLKELVCNDDFKPLADDPRYRALVDEVDELAKRPVQ